MDLSDELAQIASAAAAFADPGEEVTGVLAAEPVRGERVYLCSFGAGEERRWLAFDRVAKRLARRRAAGGDFQLEPEVGS